LTRGTSFRSTLRTIAASKVAGYYELNKPGITPSQIRAIVKQLLDNQQFILPYSETAPHTAAATEASGATPVDEITGKKDKAPKVILFPFTPSRTVEMSPQNFIATLPFHAPAIVDVLHEGWWTGPKSLGVLHVKELKSNRADRPSEVVLPDAMICLGAVNVYCRHHGRTFRFGFRIKCVVQHISHVLYLEWLCGGYGMRCVWSSTIPTFRIWTAVLP
jgi:hypothetical protein